MMQKNNRPTYISENLTYAGLFFYIIQKLSASRRYILSSGSVMFSGG